MFLKIRFVITIILFLTAMANIQGQKITYPDGWGTGGYSLLEETKTGVVINFTIDDFELIDIEVNGELFKKLILPGHFMFNEEGAPDLPGSSRFISMPEGSVAEMQIIRSRIAVLQDVNIIPAPKIPLDDDQEPLQYLKDTSIYHQNAYYPQSPVWLDGNRKIRGMSVARLGIMPFQYNPVTKELLVYRDIQVKVTFTGGTGEFGIEKYRSRWWDPILKDHVLNPSSLPKVDYSKNIRNNNRTFDGCEYLIICPDGSAFQQWADSIKKFRTEQGILTEVKTITEVGGNTSTAIETYVDNAFNNWNIPPSAILLLGDHGTDAANSITSVILNNHPDGYNPYVSDNIYADVDGDHLPDIAFARITARNAAELEVMVQKFLSYERTPPTDPGFYDHPITALGWQTTRWFQICSETIGGFLKNELGKNPVRINAVYSGNPSVDPWSTASNTTTVLNYFGPSGQGYIPSSPSTLGGWTGGDATQINNAINNGSFLLQHRDHGAYWGWGEPSYTTSNIDGLTNTDLTFIMSVNCQTGKFDYSDEVFTEKFHRYTYNGSPSGALGLIAATEVSYSFVNDEYIWGLYDYMWPDFLPTFGSNPDPGGLLPCFGNVAGKYHLEQSTWVNTYSSLYEITYNLFHHHGDAYLTLYSEVPQNLTIIHNASITPSQTTFTVTANSGALVALSCNGVIHGTATATGSPVNVPISGTLIPGEEMIITVTLTNYYRYRETVDITPPEGPYLVFSDFTLNDVSGNNNGMLDCGENPLVSVGLHNIGNIQASDVSAILRSSDTLVTIIDSTATYGNILSGDTVVVIDGFQIETTTGMPDGHEIPFEIAITAGSSSWIDYFAIEGHSPALLMLNYQIADTATNNNGICDPGETVNLNIDIKNSGTAMADSCFAYLSTSDPYIQIGIQNITFGDINPGDTSSQSTLVTADPLAPAGHPATIFLSIAANNTSTTQDSLEIVIGKIPALVLDLDPNTSSGPAMVTAMLASGINADYMTAFPDELSKYQSVFCCLGIFSSNHVLTTSEGQLLADYLDGGGKLYMEGGDTWAYDSQTPVHTYFSIDGISDGSADMTTVTGMSGTFTNTMSFTYAGENSWMDRLGALSPAITVLQNSSPVYGTAIAYDQGSYATIGASHEFGGLADGSTSKAQLMAEYLLFFGVDLTATWEGTTNNWDNPANWSNGRVPDSSTHVIIPYNPANPYPIEFSGSSAECKSLSVDPSANFTIPQGIVFTIQE